VVKAVCEVLGEAGPFGLAGDEIDHILIGIGVPLRPARFSPAAGLCMTLFTAQLNDPSRLEVFIERALRRIRIAGDPARVAVVRQRLVDALDGTGLAL
jgi:hypothetical protein